LPGWLIANWDRVDGPALNETPPGNHWGWLLVREALDGVSDAEIQGQRLIFLEKRL
jgi:hypothetical protein